MKTISIGSSLSGRNIYALIYGVNDITDKDSRQLVITASIHGREYINTDLLFRFSLELDRMEPELHKQKLSVILLPLLNPDGVLISKEIHPRFRGNQRGIDLNRNFPIGHHPSSIHGILPASEPEVRAMMALIESLANPAAVIHYHSVGSLIYWDYQVDGELRRKIKTLAEFARTYTGYRLAKKTPDTLPNGGFGDWCAYVKHIPTITIETGHFFAPVPHFQYAGICRRNLPFLRALVSPAAPI